MGRSPDADLSGLPDTRRVPEVRVNGVSLYYGDFGSGEAIVGIHGMGSSAAMWADAAPGLATRERTILARVEWVDGGHAVNPAHPVVLDFIDEVFAREEQPSIA